MTKQYAKIGMGGTFDHLHLGHREFISFAAQLADTVVIGVTDQRMTEHKQYPQLIESAEQRLEAVKALCQTREIIAEVMALHDVYGPTISDSEIDALAVTEETVSGADAINQERQRLGMPQLPVHVFQLVKDAHGVPITSTRIRAGEINRDGDNYADILSGGVQLTQQQRAFFSRPQDPIVTAAPNHATTPTFVVGDICLQIFHENNWEFHAGWFDEKSERTPLPHRSWKKAINTVKNRAGGLSAAAVTNVSHVASSVASDWCNDMLPITSHLTRVLGEEDLITIGVVMLAPLGCVVYYGQPGQGMVRLEITEQLKTAFTRSITS